MNEIVSFGEWVQARRNQLGLSRSGLARQVGCSPVTIKKIERDERRPSVQIAELIAANLQIPETKMEDFIRRARGEFVPTLISPEEMTLAEAQAPAAEEDAPKHNLPPQTTPFFGREQELDDIAKNLADPTCRLLTILGAGGMGKTRLSIEAAAAQLENFTDGVTYVALAPVNAQENSINPLAGALANTLKISFHAQETPEQQLFKYLRRKEMLIVFDNFEHLVETADFVADLLTHARDLKILITSRERLDLHEEWIYPLQGLQFPDPQDTLELDSMQSAVQLFAQRAQQLKPSFSLENELPDILRICRLVEGMPLGLELAAAWVFQLTCAEIADEIESEIDFLATKTRNVPKRHRSIRAVFGNSWERLSEKERDVLPKLSVFRGGFTRQAAQAVASAGLRTLSELVGKSLVSVSADGRYQIHELLRQLAAEKLTAANISDLHIAHCDFYLAFLSQQQPRIKGREAAEALTAIKGEIGNIRAAWQWGIEHNLQQHLRLAAETLLYYFEALGWYLEGGEIFGKSVTAFTRYQQAIDLNSDEAVSTTLQLVQLQGNLAYFQTRLGTMDDSESTITSAWQLLNSVAPDAQWEKGWILSVQAINTFYQNNEKQTIALAEQAKPLMVESGDLVWYGALFMGQAQAAHQLGHYQEAEQYALKSLEILKDQGEQLYLLFNLSSLGRLAMDRGEYQVAETFHRECLEKRVTLELQPGITFALHDLGDVARRQEKYDEAQDYYQRSMSAAHEINLPHAVARALWGLGNLSVAAGQYQLAKSYFEKCISFYGRNQRMLGGLGWAELGLGNLAAAREQFHQDLETFMASEKMPEGLDGLAGLAHVIAIVGELSCAIELLALIQHHPATAQETKDKVQKLWEELAAELPANLIAEAEARGRELDLFEAAAAILAEGVNA